MIGQKCNGDVNWVPNLKLHLITPCLCHMSPQLSGPLCLWHSLHLYSSSPRCSSDSTWWPAARKRGRSGSSGLNKAFTSKLWHFLLNIHFKKFTLAFSSSHSCFWFDFHVLTFTFISLLPHPYPEWVERFTLQGPSYNLFTNWSERYPLKMISMHVPNRIEDKCLILLVFRKLLSDSSESFAERWSKLLFENLLFHCIEDLVNPKM